MAPLQPAPSGPPTAKVHGGPAEGDLGRGVSSQQTALAKTVHSIQKKKGQTASAHSPNGQLTFAEPATHYSLSLKLRGIGYPGPKCSPLLPIVGATGDWLPRLARLDGRSSPKVMWGNRCPHTLVRPLKVPFMESTGHLGFSFMNDWPRYCLSPGATGGFNPGSGTSRTCMYI